jgi:SAM-dependent methyltransferase
MDIGNCVRFIIFLKWEAHGSAEGASMTNERLYGDHAWTFPILSPLEGYLDETEYFIGLFRDKARIPLRSLLHLGCGAGQNDYVFKRHFQTTGVDRSEAMLEIARRLNPEVEYLSGDLRRVRLGRTFDAVAAVDSLDYLRSAADWRAAVGTAAAHLAPGGAFFFLLESTRETFLQNRTTVTRGRRDDIEIAFIQNDYDPDPADSEYEAAFVSLIRRSGKLEILTDRHVLGLFARAEIEGFLREAGFEVEAREYMPGPPAIERSGQAGHETYPMFVCVRS